MSDEESERLGPTPEQIKKFQYERTTPAREGHSDEQAGVETVRNVAQTYLQRYYQRQQINYQQLMAGETLLYHWFYGGLEQRVTGKYDDTPGLSDNHYGLPASERQAHHRAELRKVFREIGQVPSAILVSVVIMDQPAGDYALRSNNVSKRDASAAGMYHLREALDALAYYWRIPDDREFKNREKRS